LSGVRLIIGPAICTLLGARGDIMVKHFDHITIVVRDMESAKNFFGLFGFQHEQS